MGDPRKKSRLVQIGLLLLTILILALAALYFSMTYSLQPDTAVQLNGDPGSPAASKAKSILQEKAADYPGLSAAAGKDEGIRFTATAGFTNLKTQSHPQATTQFRIYSVSKPITATALMQLYEKGRVDLDAPVTRYVPELPGEFSKVSIRQLAGHLSGVRDYKSGEWLKLSSVRCGDVTQALSGFIGDAIKKPPGEFQYSTLNYVILSRVIEQAAGISFADYMKHNIFEPANMKETTFDSIDKGHSLSEFYEEAFLGRVRVARPVNNSCKWGAGGLNSSAQDLVQFALALINERLISRSSLNLMFTSMKDSKGKSTEYGFGWGIVKDEHGRMYAAHSGGAFGGRAALVIYPSQKTAVAILANLEGGRLTKEAQEIASLFIDTP